jgi:glucokinase
VNLLDVEAVILGGGLGTRFGQPMADRIAALMRPYLFQADKAPPVVPAALGDRGGAIGATLLVR